MNAKLIVAYENQTWTSVTIDIPAKIIPDKYHRGSVKWNKAAVKWASENVDLGEGTIVYVDVLDANP